MSDKIKIELGLNEIKVIIGLLNYADPTNFFLKQIKEDINKQVQSVMSEPKV